MKRRLIWQIYPSYLIIIVLVIIGLGWYVSLAVRDFYYDHTANDLAARAQLISQQLDGRFSADHSAEMQPLMRRLGESSSTRITIIRRDGLVLADSHEDAKRMENHGQRPEVKAAMNSASGRSTRFSNTLGQTLMYVALPYEEQGQIVGTIRTARSVSDIDQALSGITWKMVIGGFLVALLAAPISWILSRKICRPLELMTTAAQKFARGDLEAPLIESGTEEAHRLAQSLNTMAHELSERINREVEQRGEIEAILGCMVEGIIAVDIDENVIRLNSAAAELFATNAESEPNRPIQEVIRHADLQRFVSRALSSDQPLEDELTLLGTQKRYLHIQAAPLKGEGNVRIGVLIVLHDLTRLRQLESVRRDFVANVSHELKTPITAIRGAVETLIDEKDSGSPEQRFLEIIFKQSERLNALVEDLLDLSRIEQGVNQGALELQWQELEPVLKSSVIACESLMKQQQVTIEIDCPGNLQAQINAPLLEQAVINLLTNAIKYSESGQSVVVRALEKAGNLIVEVEDHGCGIDEKHQARLFERFYRIDQARSRSQGGTGLGLAIVKHIAYAHKGEVGLKSSLGKGSTFSISVPQIKKIGV